VKVLHRFGMPVAAPVNFVPGAGRLQTKKAHPASLDCGSTQNYSCCRHT
jgi:hypothetical protein